MLYSLKDCPDTQTHIQRTDCSAWTTKVMAKNLDDFLASRRRTASGLHYSRRLAHQIAYLFTCENARLENHFDVDWQRLMTRIAKLEINVLDRGSRSDRPRYCVTTPTRAGR